MANYTVNLYTVLQAGTNIFDFDYTRSVESQTVLSNEDLEQGFIDRYTFNEIGFETVELFKHYLKVQWKESIANFDKLLVAYNENVNIKSNMSTTSASLSTYEDTPQSELAGDYLTNRTNGNGSNTGYAGVTEIELLKDYKDNLPDIQSEFYDSLGNLFMGIF